MENEIVMYEGQQAIIKTKGLNYTLTSPFNGTAVTLQRDIDFGMVNKAKRPSLFKAGAEKVANAYGLLQHYTIETKIERVDDDPLFFYVVRCDLVKIANDGKEYVFTTGYGSSSTKEKRNGFNGAFDSANGTLKMACKRSLVAAAINIGGISGAFYQDLEDSDFVEGGYKAISNTQDPQSRISAAMVKRLFAIANSAGINASKAKERLAILGYTKATELTQEKYDEVCELMGLDDEEFKERTKKQ